uniref:PFQ25.2 n=1 Tax=Streptomyces sp. F2 TaxID=317660 RepID=Q58IT9_9ACTN|nr:pFQ25.2 [Streptomyces sp. F2]
MSLAPDFVARQERPLMSQKPSVLFVCVHNAGRSQMAAAWLTHLAGDRVEVRSAGSAPADQVNPAAVEAMREVGIDISAETPKILTVDAVKESDVCITMGCGDTCPSSPASDTWTGSWRTRPARASRPYARSGTRSRSSSRA